MEFSARRSNFDPALLVLANGFDGDRMKTWSLESGYGSPPPMFRHSESSKFDFFECPPTDPFVRRGYPSGGMRPITKQSEVSFSPEMEDGIRRLSEQLAEIRMAEWKSGKGGPFQQHYVQLPICHAFDSGSETVSNHQFSTSVKHGSEHRRQSKKSKTPSKGCEFCRNNGSFDWESHRCKNSKGETLCPILQQMICPTCGATGKSAHTKRHCPVAQSKKQARLEKALRGSRY